MQGQGLEMLGIGDLEPPLKMAVSFSVSLFQSLFRILMELTPPISTTSSGHSYSVTSDDLEKINALH